MAPKLAALTLFLVGMACALLLVRQQRIDVMHETAALRSRVEAARHEVWRRQADFAERLRPDDMRRRIEHVQIALEPAVPDFERRQPSSPLLAQRTPSR